jgi:hypothetical protein
MALLCNPRLCSCSKTHDPSKGADIQQLALSHHGTISLRDVSSHITLFVSHNSHMHAPTWIHHHKQAKSAAALRTQTRWTNHLAKPLAHRTLHCAKVHLLASGISHRGSSDGTCEGEGQRHKGPERTTNPVFMPCGGPVALASNGGPWGADTDTEHFALMGHHLVLL